MATPSPLPTRGCPLATVLTPPPQRRRPAPLSSDPCRAPALPAQLPPVNGAYAFTHPAFERLRVVDLVANQRAAGGEFRAVLARLRLGKSTPADLGWLAEHARQEPVTNCGLFAKNRLRDAMNAACEAALTTPRVPLDASDALLTRTWHGDRHVEDEDKWDQIHSQLSGQHTGETRAPALAPEEMAELKPPRDAPERVVLRVGARVVLTRAIWKQTPAGEAAPPQATSVQTAQPDAAGDGEEGGGADDADDGGTGAQRPAAYASKPRFVLIVAKGESGLVRRIDREDDGSPVVMVAFERREGAPSWSERAQQRSARRSAG